MKEHGTYNRYTKHGCRCAECREANATYQRNWRQRNRAERRQPGKHGGRQFSNYGCRCDVCIAGQKQYQAGFTTQAARNRDPELQRITRKRHARKVQAETSDRAFRHGQQWTGPELEVLARKDLTVREKALQLGRTYKAVVTMLQKLNHEEPVPSWLAGERVRLH